MRRSRRSILARSLAAATLLATLAGAQESVTEEPPSPEASADVDATAGPERNAYFGELHIHSSWSIDAYVFGTRIGPEDATRYAMGQPVAHSGGYEVELAQPLDSIWYTPSAEARRAGHPGTTVAALLREGAKPLDNTALENTIVGKKIRVHNLVTGDWLEFVYDSSGKRLVSPIDGKSPNAIIAGDRFFDREAPYEIHDGRIVTTLDGTPFEMVLYAFGDRYIAARSDEYGYANYEISF